MCLWGAMSAFLAHLIYAHWYLVPLNRYNKEINVKGKRANSLETASALSFTQNCESEIFYNF